MMKSKSKSKSKMEKLSGIKVNKAGALAHATESNTDILSIIKEYLENGIQHGATNIDITIEGKSKDKKNKNQVEHNVEMSKLIISDNGNGMSHDTVLSKFSRIHIQNFDPNSISRNGLGTKTGFGYYENMRVTTTTSDQIPEFSDEYCDKETKEEELKEIRESFERHSSLSVGDMDSEKRVYLFERMGDSYIEGFEPCSEYDHGTTIELSVPRKTLVESVDAIARMLKHQVLFLRGTDNQFTITYPLKRGTHTITINKGIDEEKIPVSSLAMITGNSKDGVVFCRFDDKGVPVKSVDISDKLYAEKDCYIEVDLRLYKDSTYEDKDIKKGNQIVQKKVGDYLEMVCGSTIDDLFSDCSSPTERITSLTGRFKTGHTSTINSQVRGYVIVHNSVALKKALRENRREMDRNDANVVEYERMLKSFLSKFGSTLTDYNATKPAVTSAKIQKDLESTLIRRLRTFDSQVKSRNRGTKSESHENKMKKYSCSSCRNTWKVPKSETPKECPKCKSKSINRFKMSYNNINIRFEREPINKSYRICSFNECTENGPEFVFWENNPELIKLRNYTDQKGKVKKESDFTGVLKQRLETEALKVYSIHKGLENTDGDPDDIIEYEANLMRLRFHDNSCFTEAMRNIVLKEYKSSDIKVDGITSED
jgi:predicted Zn-ribbon and HTH transcriptional regulator